MTTKAGIIGATGYGGLEIARLLLNHPQVEIACVSSVSFTGQKLSQVYPSMAGILDMVLEDDKAVVAKSDVVFASLPHGLSEEIAAACYKEGKIFIDMGGDFRLEKEEEYTKWYGGQYGDKALHQAAVYGQTELFRDKIKGAKIIANPGCYPTSVALGLAPLIKAEKIDLISIIIDAKSGVTGAGRGLSQTTHFPDCNESFSPYKVANHRHMPEIEQTLTQIAGKEAKVTFVPHLLPVNRGILSTIYCGLTGDLDMDTLHGMYTDFYQNEKFVRVMPKGSTANINQIQFSNYCDISLHLDAHTNRVIVVSTIDNMLKGAAGQAVQNMNVICGFPEDTALNLIPPAF